MKVLHLYLSVIPCLLPGAHGDRPGVHQEVHLTLGSKLPADVIGNLSSGLLCLWVPNYSHSVSTISCCSFS